MVAYRRNQLINKWFLQMDRACRLGDLHTCQQLMSRNGSFKSLKKLPGPFLVNMRDQVYFTSLVHAACRSGSLELLQFLVSQGALLSHLDLVGNTALHHAMVAGDKGLEIAKYLLKTHQRSIRRSSEAELMSQSSTNVMFDFGGADVEEFSREEKDTKAVRAAVQRNLTAQLFYSTVTK
jgi:ankyrin repeat protein